MRVIGGEYRGRVLREFKGNDIRPTSDMARESLFNILRNKVAGSKFLDLFCGTGAVGLESISRGAEFVVFNDLSKQSIALTKNNLESLNVPQNRYRLSCGDAMHFIDNSIEVFDVVFIDAPYKDEAGIEALKKAYKVLSYGGIVIYENEKPFDTEINNVEKYDERRYGRAYLTFFRKK